VVRCPDAEIVEFLTCTIATHFMANRIVLPFVDADELPEEEQKQMKSTLGMQLTMKNATCCTSLGFFMPSDVFNLKQSYELQRQILEMPIVWQSYMTVASIL
jgi:hypothetical protein